MDTENNPYQNQLNENLWEETLYNQTVNSLRTEERFQNYFKQFDPRSVEPFIKAYAQKKVFWHRFGDFNINNKLAKEKEGMENCFEALAAIQQKKLFNLQCLWRADQIKLKGVEICEHFWYWELFIFECPALQPVMEEEIDLYIRYLKESPLNEVFDWGFSFQEYKTLKEGKDGIAEDFNNLFWYRFYDSQMGTKALLDLPDIRGQKEEFYKQLYLDNEKEDQEPQEVKTKEPRKGLPNLDPNANNFNDNFIRETETKAFYNLFLEHKRNHEKFDKSDSAENCIFELQDIPLEYYEAEPADDWRTSMEMTYERYRREVLIATMPRAYEFYLEHLNDPSQYPYTQSTEDHRKLHHKLLDEMHRRIVEGRALNGEPADLNF